MSARRYHLSIIALAALWIGCSNDSASSDGSGAAGAGGNGGQISCRTRADGTCFSEEGCESVEGWYLDEPRDCLAKQVSAFCIPKSPYARKAFEPPTCYELTPIDGPPTQVWLSFAVALKTCAIHKPLCE